MTWIVPLIPIALVAFAVATGPIIWAVVHQHRYGSGARSDRAPGGGDGRPEPARPTVDAVVCPYCSALVSDGPRHERAVHRAA
jgi:hypothetical protein